MSNPAGIEGIEQEELIGGGRDYIIIYYKNKNGEMMHWNC